MLISYHIHSLFLFAVIAGTTGSIASTVHVQTGSALAAAVADPAVDRIVVDGPIRLESTDFGSEVVRLTRNLTITSDAAGPHQVIDFNARDVRNKISIGPGHNLSLVHLTVKETRYGPGADVDILASSPDGILHLADTAKLQTSCGALVKKNILAYVRDDAVPGINVIGFPPTVVWDNVTYVDPIVYKNFSTRMGVGENAADRGYVVHKNHSWKLCQKVADPACVAQSDTATCVKQDQDEYYFTTHPRPSTPAPLSAPAKAGIAVGAAATGLLLLLLAAVLFIRKARGSKQQQALLPTTSSPKLTGGDSSSDGPSPAQSLDCTPYSRGDSLDSMVRSGYIKAPSSGVAVAVKPRPAGLPSILRGTLTEDQAAAVQLGVLVGAGSYGRVFAGRLGAKEVAIKVIHHDDSTAQQVASEVSMMMQFNHVNLVKAYHYITWGAAGLSNRLTCPDKREIHDSAKLRSVLVSAGGSSSDADSGSTISANSQPRRSSHRMLETWIICELCNGGNMQDAVMMREHSAFFEGDTPQMGILLQTLLGVAKGMARLHASNVLHGDLKAANVLLYVKEPEATAAGSDGAKEDGSGGDAAAMVELVPKVSDFGLSRVMGEGATHHSTHTMGTLTHQAPELMKTGRLSKAADVFSFGVIMWEVFTAVHPWKGLTMGEVMTAVMIEDRRLIWGPGAPKAYAALAGECWQAEPEARPSFPRLVVALQQLLEQHEALQAEVDKANRRVGTF